MSIGPWITPIIIALVVLVILGFFVYFVLSFGKPIDIQRQVPEDRWYADIDWENRETYELTNMPPIAEFNLNQWWGRIFHFELSNGAEIVTDDLHVASQPPKATKVVGTDYETGREFCILANAQEKVGYLTFRE